MCILCVIQKWSRRVATMLPWLVIPLIGLWGLSQLLPPAFRFEITSPRLACVVVLLVTLFWYEVLMPQLSAWRVRRNAMLRERKRFEAIELHKLRKTATRRCRNCKTPYRDQNPGGGRFMCSYCGHMSKRPVLDLPVPGMGLSNSGIIKVLVEKVGRILTGKVWSENGSMYGQDSLENGNWVGGSITGKSSYCRKDGSSVFGGDESCLAEKSYSGVVNFACKLLTSFFLSVRWLWRKLFRISTSGEDDASDTDHNGSAKRGENGANLNESRGEKARRKAEEKRQARIEKELLEEEERKQREEVARLVEERRRIRDEKKEAERGKSSPPAREKDTKREAEKKRQERRKEKDKGSSKSNSEAEELEKRAGKESERKRDFDKKSDIDRHELLKSGVDFLKGQSTETGHSVKSSYTNNFIQGNAGSRYLDRMRGTIFNSSKAFGGGSFFGKGANTAVTKETQSSSSVDHVHIYAQKRDLYPPERVAARPFMNGDDKSVHRPVHSEPQTGTAPKKSWQQLFTRSSSVPSSSSVNVISRPNAKSQTEVQSPQLSGQSSSVQSFDNPINFGLPSPFVLSTTYPKASTSSSLGFSPAIDPILPRIGEGHHERIPEEPELFEDPCYVPDPVSLLGPVSESLDNFQLDMGTGFVKDMGLERSRTLKNGPASSEVNKPSPIESPMSREKHNNSSRFPSTPKAQDMHASPLDDANANDKGTWQMWNSCPLGHDGLGFAGGSPSWFLPPELNRSNKDDLTHPSSVSLFTSEDQVVSGSQSPKNQSIFLGNGQNGGTFSPVTGSSDHDPWLQKAFFPPLSTAENCQRCTESTQQSLRTMADPSLIETTSKSSSAGGGGSDASRIGDVKQWLTQEFSQAGKEVPDFEYTPRSVAYLHNLATLSQAQTQASKILASDFRLKASEYRAQAARIREILESVGLAQEGLGSNVVSSAQVLANVANLLNIRDTELSSFLVAMGDISLRKTGVEEKRAKAQKESNVLLDYTRKAISRLTYLKRTLAQLEDDAGQCEEHVEHWKNNLALMLGKEKQYNQETVRFKDTLNRVGYTPEISHGVLVELAERRKELEKKTKPVLDTLRSYQDLPPDKALAALAIEDKKRQYAAAEKYLEDVLHSALATSE